MKETVGTLEILLFLQERNGGAEEKVEEEAIFGVETELSGSAAF